jgi:hypothetical protein
LKEIKKKKRVVLLALYVKKKHENIKTHYTICKLHNLHSLEENIILCEYIGSAPALKLTLEQNDPRFLVSLQVLKKNYAFDYDTVFDFL